MTTASSVDQCALGQIGAGPRPQIWSLDLTVLTTDLESGLPLEAKFTEIRITYLIMNVKTTNLKKKIFPPNLNCY